MNFPKMSWWSSLLELFFPRTCVMCGKKLLPGEEFLCLSCLMRLPRTHYERQPDSPLWYRFAGRAQVERAAGYFFYERGASTARVLYQLKYHHCPEIGVYLGRRMGEALLPSGFFEGIDVLVPVPLAPKKKRKRGYNQCEELAKGLSAVTGLPMDTRSLVRRVANPTQTTKGRLERWGNVQGIFAMTDVEALRGKHLLLLDDVVTTGATLLSCMEALREVPDIRISVLALAVAGHR
jgi:ComF family protein